LRDLTLEASFIELILKKNMLVFSLKCALWWSNFTIIFSDEKIHSYTIDSCC